MLSIDFQAIDALLPYQHDEVAELLRPHILEIDQYETVCTVMFNNTLHQSFDVLAPSITLQRPFGHIGELLNKALVEQEIKKAVLVGTKYTMNAGYIASFFPTSTELILPDEGLQNQLEALRKIYYTRTDEALAQACFQQLQALNADTIILACTEHSIAFAPFPRSYFMDTMDLQCEFAVKSLLGIYPLA